MEIFADTTTLPHRYKESFITIGNFDGVHRGHQYLFAELLGKAKENKAPALIVTFDPHPKMVLHPEIRPFYLLTTREEKLALLAHTGLDVVVVIPFDLVYAQKTADAFVEEILWKHLQVRKIFIGQDYRFGKNKEGDSKLLHRWGERLGFEVTVIPPFFLNGDVVSSTRIRKAILRGEVDLARLLLGRPYNVFGRVIAGKGRGHSLGFPTANVEPFKDLLPARGVYAVFANVEEKVLRGVMNIGTNPTFDNCQLSLEVHLLNFSGNLYGKRIDIHFVERIREERLYPNERELSSQIREDIKKAEEILNAYPLVASEILWK